VQKLQARTDELPWAELIHQRELDFDLEMEPELVRRRVAYFYPETPPV